MSNRMASTRTALRLGGLLGILLYSPIVDAHFEEPEGHQDIAWQVGFLVEHVDVDAAAANAMIREIDDGERLRSAVDLEIAAGRAVITEAVYLLTRNAQRAQMTTAHEFLYPASWDPPKIPPNLKLLPGGATDIAVPASVTSFEMEPVGHFLDIDPNTSFFGEHPMLNSIIRRVRLTGLKKHGGERNQISQPTFEVGESALSIAHKYNAPTLLTATTPTDRLRKGRLDLTFVRSFNENVPTPEPEKADGLEAPPKTKTNLSITVEMIEFDRELVPALFPSASDPKSHAPPYQNLAEQVRHGEAKRLASTLIRTRSGERAKGGAGSEYIYGTENDSSQVPGNLTSPPADRSQITAPVSPTAFDSRKLGLSVETEPWVVGNGSQILLDITIEHISLDREQVYGQDEGEVKQPIFSSTKITTGVVVQTATHQLLAITTPREAGSGDPVHGRRVAVFVRVDKIE